jgi:hypothetical protein
VLLAVARDRACFLAIVRAPPAFFAVVRDRERFAAVVRPRRFFAPFLRFPDGFFVARTADFEAVFTPVEVLTRVVLLAGRPGEACGELRGVDPSKLCPRDCVPLEPAMRIPRINSRPVATAPSTAAARSSCFTALRALPRASGAAAALRLNTFSFRLLRQRPVLGNLDDAATMTAAGPTLAALARVLIAMPFLACGPFRQRSTTLSPLGRARAPTRPIGVRCAPEQPT